MASGEREFEGKVALVTGGARGIGRASAFAFARRGAEVVVCDLLDDDAAVTLKGIEAFGGRAVYVRTDVADEAAVARAVERAVSDFGRLDFAHNNAGVLRPGSVESLSLNDWQTVLSVNLTGIFLAMKYELPEIAKASSGAIVNTASVWGLAGAAGQAAYVASKHGVVGLTRTAAADFGKKGVRINAIAPGPIETAMTASVPKPDMDAVIARTTLGRYGQPAEVGELVAWLCSEGASYVNGAVLPIDGGWSAV